MSDACAGWYAFAEDCGVDFINLLLVEVQCHNMEEAFIDDFAGHFISCMEERGCDELTALLEGEEDANTEGEPDIMQACMGEAAAEATPGPANRELMEHYCEYLIQCDPETTTPTECAAVIESQGLGLAMFIDEPFVDDADACVDPMPGCDDDVQGCFDGVAAEVTRAMSIGGD